MWSVREERRQTSFRSNRVNAFGGAHRSPSLSSTSAAKIRFRSLRKRLFYSYLAEHEHLCLRQVLKQERLAIFPDDVFQSRNYTSARGNPGVRKDLARTSIDADQFVITSFW